MNSKKKGDIGLAKAISYYTGLGWTVSIPLTDSQDYDLIVDPGNGPERVQVKTSSGRSFGLRVLGGNRSWNGVAKHFDNTRVERLFLFSMLTGEMYDVPASAVTQRSSIVPVLDYFVGR